MKPIAFFDPIGHQGHSQEGHPERPDRVEVIKRTLQATGHWQLGPQLKPATANQELLLSVHSEAHLRRLEEFSAQGRSHDGETYLTKKSWPLAMQAAGGAIAVADAVWERQADKGFALTRPPGHHATRGQAMGFCLMNNVAIAAEYLLQAKGAKRIAILDIDVHHGNGTQDVFYARDDVFFCSLHQSPLYPGSGSLRETGTGAGDGYTQNLPLPPYSGDEGYLEALRRLVIPSLERFAPEMCLVSFGYDAHWRDPLASMNLSAKGYYEIMGVIAAFADAQCGGRMAVFLEGGYDLEAGAACGLAVTQGLLGEPFADELGAAPFPDNRDWQTVLNAAVSIWDL